MQSRFWIRDTVAPDQAPWGHSRFVSHPGSTGAQQLAVLEATIAPGQGHGFHNHPAQEEVLTVVEGAIEQWMGTEKRILGPGDAIIIAPGVVHASFNVGAADARVLAAFGPCTDGGFDMVDVSGEAPWRDLRA